MTLKNTEDQIHTQDYGKTGMENSGEHLQDPHQHQKDDNKTKKKMMETLNS
jgi:hypothetical protein